jgi:hypothetical protein
MLYKTGQLAVVNIINNIEDKIQDKQDTKQEELWQQLRKNWSIKSI